MFNVKLFRTVTTPPHYNEYMLIKWKGKGSKTSKTFSRAECQDNRGLKCRGWWFWFSSLGGVPLLVLRMLVLWKHFVLTFFFLPWIIPGGNISVLGTMWSKSPAILMSYFINCQIVFQKGIDGTPPILKVSSPEPSTLDSKQDFRSWLT
jgi:hypothetical protein